MIGKLLYDGPIHMYRVKRVAAKSLIDKLQKEQKGRVIKIDTSKCSFIETEAIIRYIMKMEKE